MANAWLSGAEVVVRCLELLLFILSYRTLSGVVLGDPSTAINHVFLGIWCSKGSGRRMLIRRFGVVLPCIVGCVFYIHRLEMALHGAQRGVHDLQIAEQL